jgi:molybdate/tungstate transport system substrate-binding protein
MNKNTSILLIIIVVIIAVGYVVGSGTYLPQSDDENGTITVYAAASLSGLMNSTVTKFKEKHPNVNVQVKPGGSSDLISEITNLNQSQNNTVDILASADYGLIDTKLIPNFADYNIEFARNEMVLAYTDKSKNNSEINKTNWYQILNQNDVKFAIAEPNSAPAGYRAVMLLDLASSYYNNTTIFEDLIAKNTAITSTNNGDNHIISSPNNLNPKNTKIFSKPSVSELLPLLETGDADYAFVYKSDVEGKDGKGKNGIKYLEFEPELALSNTTFESIYSNYKLDQFSDSDKKKTITLTPIVYGVTILNNAPNKGLAIEFIKLLLSPDGNKLTTNSYQDPITPAIITNISKNIPSEFGDYIKKP